MVNCQLHVDYSAIRDNYLKENVGEFLKAKIQLGSKLSIVSAYFTIYAFEVLKHEFLHIDSLNFYLVILSLS